MLLLTTEEKFHIATTQHEALRKRFYLVRASYEKSLDTLSTSVEETDLRISDMKRDAYELKKEVFGVLARRNRKVESDSPSHVGAVGTSANPSTAANVSPSADKVLRYYETNYKQRAKSIEQYRLKNHGLIHTKQKIQMQLKQKDDDDRNENLNGSKSNNKFLDYQHLIVENQQLSNSIQETNVQICLVKSTLHKLEMTQRTIEINMKESMYTKENQKKTLMELKTQKTKLEEHNMKRRWGGAAKGTLGEARDYYYCTGTVLEGNTKQGAPSEEDDYRKYVRMYKDNDNDNDTW